MTDMQAEMENFISGKWEWGFQYRASEKEHTKETEQTSCGQSSHQRGKQAYSFSSKALGCS